MGPDRYTTSVVAIYSIVHILVGSVQKGGFEGVVEEQREQAHGRDRSASTGNRGEPAPSCLHVGGYERHAFLARWSSRPTRWSSGAPRRPAWSTRWAFWPTGRAFWPTGWAFWPAGRSFGTTTGWFFIGQLCRFLGGRRRALLRTAVRTEVGSLVGKLRAAVRTEVDSFVGKLRAAVRTEAGSFVGKLRTAVRAKPLFFGTFLGQCGVLSLRAYLSSGTRIPLSLTVSNPQHYRSRTPPLAASPTRTMFVAVVALAACRVRLTAKTALARPKIRSRADGG